MAILDMNNWKPGRVKAAVLGDVLSLVPTDGGVESLLTRTVTTKPGGSSAAFSSANITPDVVGAYVLTVSAGSASVAFTVYVFSAAVLASAPIALVRNAPGTGAAWQRPDADRRSLLENIANAITSAELTAANTTPGTFPASVNLFGLGAA